MNGIKRTEEQKGTEHEIRARIALNVALTPYQRSYYLLFMATADQTKEFVRNEKKAVRI